MFLLSSVGRYGGLCVRETEGDAVIQDENGFLLGRDP